MIIKEIELDYRTPPNVIRTTPQGDELVISRVREHDPTRVDEIRLHVDELAEINQISLLLGWELLAAAGLEDD